METSPLVSVVTPFYNTREFLAECIESVLCQTFQNFEYILVDNCSTDGSSEVAQSYASRFPCTIRLVGTRSFLSQVKNYNFALSCISPNSRYCKMVQADDRIYPECLERMVALAESDVTIGIVSSYRMRGNVIAGHGFPRAKTVISGHDACRLQLTGSCFFFGSPTTLLYRSEIVHSGSPFFDENTLHDDTDACYRILQNWKLGFVHQVLSCNRIDNESITSRIRDFSPELLDRLLQLHKFGSVYLEQNELNNLQQNCELEYYGFLARRLLAGSSQRFWQYHASGLRSGGLELDKMRLFKRVFRELLRFVRHPRFTSVRLYDRFRTRIKSSQKNSQRG